MAGPRCTLTLVSRSGLPIGSARRRLAVAAGLCALAWALAGVSLALLVGGHATLHDFDPTTVVLPLTLAAVGMVVVAHVPRNPLGWLFLAGSCVVGLEAISGALAYRSLALHQAPHDLGVWSEWVENWLGGVLFPSGLVAVIMVLIPTGQLPSQRWRWSMITGPAQRSANSSNGSACHWR